MKELRAKPFEVKKSIKNLDKSYDMQLKMATIKDSQITDDEVDTTDMTDEQIAEVEKKQQAERIELIQRQKDLQNTFVDFIVDILRLSEKEKDKLTDLEWDDVVDKALYITMRITGMTDADIEKSREEEEDEGLE